MINDETMQRLREKLEVLAIEVPLPNGNTIIGSLSDDPETLNDILQALAAEIERAKVGARIYQEQQKITMNLDINTSADYKRGFQDALDQLDTISNKRIAELQSKTGGDNAKGN
jgi:hypothetical protein